MVTLPPGVWQHIGSFCDREDLLQLALVSRSSLASARAILAEEVVLRGDKRHELDHKRNLQFLVDTQLSTKIKSFSIDDFDKYGSLDFPVKAMPNLQSLSISNCEAFSSNKQKQIVNSLRESCTQLRTINISSPFSIIFSHKKFSIPNVVTVRWSEAGYLTPALFSLCQASLSTITHLTITVKAPSWPSVISHHEGIKTYQRFFRLRFPALSSLDIGPGHDSLTAFGDDETDGAFAKFLHAHCTLEKLVLAHSPDNSSRDTYLPVDAKTLVGLDTLPALRYLEAHPRVVAELIQEEAHFLAMNVETLCIAEAIHPEEWTVDMDDIVNGNDEELMPLLSVIYRLIESSKRTLAVKHLIVHLSRMSGDGDALDFISSSLIAATRCFPNLETWVGSIPVIQDNFVELFSKFPRLRIVSGTLGLYEPIDKGSVLKLANTCKYLERVTCLETGQSFVVDRVGEDGKPCINMLGTFPESLFKDGPEFAFVIHDTLYRACDSEVFSEDEDWGLGDSEEEEWN